MPRERGVNDEGVNDEDMLRRIEGANDGAQEVGSEGGHEEPLSETSVGLVERCKNA